MYSRNMSGKLKKVVMFMPISTYLSHFFFLLDSLRRLHLIFVLNAVYLELPSINRGYYMAARRYEISLRVLKNISRVRCAHSWNIFSTREEKFRISKRSCNVLYKHQWNTKPFHFNSFLVWRRDLLCSHSNGVIFTCEDIKYQCNCKKMKF